MAKNPVEFAGLARFIGSMAKDDEMCDFYEIETDGNISYVYIPIDAKSGAESP
jgi:hypothetical protein